jgi:fused signal recognition particle receptor
MSGTESKKRGFFKRLFTSEEEAEAPVEERSEQPESEAAAEAPPPPEAPASAETEQQVQEAEPAPEPEADPEPVEEAEFEPAPEPVVAEEAVAEPAPNKAKPEKKGWFARLKSGLTRSSSALSDNISAVFTKRKLDADTIEDLEDVLVAADLGFETACTITEAIARTRFNKEISTEEVTAVLAEEVEKVLKPVALPLVIDGSNKPHVILVVGVNGTGKTTTIGKLASVYQGEGKKVMLAAGDTFRAAAIEQLKIWGERTKSPVVARDIGADAAGLVFDAIADARKEGSDVLLIDTAGRLQNKADLMAELDKVVRVIRKQDETAPHDVVLVLDATTGQNAVQQVEIFKNIAGVTGLIMTKLDGTARGGILVAIAARFGLPVHAIGVGEGIEDLQPFEAGQFARAIAGTGE